ncbi:MAG: hypothetical protein LUG91_00225 [Ruminococcus sp.]|nr:hypothetical protein [Ruminococcus sp.]
MAKEWYLLKTPHDQISGYEDEALNDFCEESFYEVLESEISDDVELCNYDLSICTPMRAVVQNNVQDTRLKTLSRAVLLPIGSCKAGMYIKYKNRYWLVIGLVDDNKMYEKAIVTLCNYLLTWINNKKQIVQRWVNAASASQYNNGETSTQSYFVRSDQLLILMPDDNECLMLQQGQRFIMDKRCKMYEEEFEGSVLYDTSKSVITYQLTRSDSILYDYQDSGHYEFMAYQDEQHENDGYYVIDGKGYWLCEKPDIEDETAILSSEIEFDTLEIFNGLDAGIFKAVFYDDNGDVADVSPQWDIECDFLDNLTVEYDGNSVCISVDNKELINKSFELSLGAENYETISVTVTIRAFI